MKLSDTLEKKLRNVYEPLSYIEMRFRENDIAFKTDKDGNPILLFVGTRTADGKIKGNRFSRTLIRDKDGKIIKDHWEQKGKATP